MATKGQILKYILGFILAVLLEVCVAENLQFPDEQTHHIEKREAVSPGFTTRMATTKAAPPTTTTKTTTTITPTTSTTTITTTTTTTPTSTSTTQTTTKATTTHTTATPPTVLQMSMRIDQIFDTSLTNETGTKYKFYVDNIEFAIDRSYKDLSTYIKGSVNVTGFRSGSIIADYTIKTVNNNSISVDLSSANTQVSKILSKVGIPVDPDGFSERNETKMTTKDKYYPQQSMELRCSYPKSVLGRITWLVKKKDPEENSAKYTITNNGSGSTLLVKDVSENDIGIYSCIIQRSTIQIPYVQWQKIVIEQRPNIIVDKSEIRLPCTDQDQTVTLRCCAQHYSIEWDRIPFGDELTKPEPDCITLQHKILSTSCESNEIAICRLKNMKELEMFEYYEKIIHVQRVRDFDCKNQSLGVGKLGDFVTGPCVKGLEGHITYQCEQANSTFAWKPTQSECVVESIKYLERKAKFLSEEEIPGFMSTLSKAAEQNKVEIKQSAPTVRTIAEILFKIAEISQTFNINVPVIKDFLKTVILIVADESKNTWAELKNGQKTENRGTELLQEIAKISDRLSNDNFMFNEGSIQLNRTTIKSSFIGTSLLPNSTTQMVIPNVVKSALTITIIVFTKLDYVLPTRTTTINDNKTSENRINGDVVVIKAKVNNTINNILLTFDKTNTSLGNPQCVFWNIDLDRWDSTGCKVKISGNEADKVTCECTHRTSFSILLSPVANEDPFEHADLAYITYIGVGISIACLVFCLFLEMCAWRLMTRNSTYYMRHVSIVNIAVSLLIADICFIIGAAIADQDITQEQMISVAHCSPVVFFLHFFYLALFFWMFFSALLLLHRIVTALSQMSRTKMMIIAFTIGYGAPLLIALITVASTAGAENYVLKKNACWLNWTESKALLAFVIPALTIFAFMCVVLCKILRRRVGATSQPDERDVLVATVRFVATLTPIFCLTWGFGIGTMVSPDFVIHVVFSALNSLQGLFVLVFGTLSDSKVLESLPGKLILYNFGSGRTRRNNPLALTTSRLQRMNVANTSGTRSLSTASSSSSSR
ncbi:adhesion G protein-coupled receptor F5-like [Triplophysa dalaica]|uniref:adhesion G protein-coupled receptor F5-like n=1 Tax=Triplophysa dalaica TaxID=1582913 RepID=UPI0024DFAC89|nr:adhesion G protein-coupled receptor F5-like [Triplophysa dalaica]